MAFFEPIRWRYTHFIHHGNTYSTENPYDHEIEYGNDLKNTIPKLIKEIIPFGNLVYIKNDISFEVIKHSLGIKTKVMKDSIPDKLKSKSILISRIYVFIWLLVISFSIYVNSWLPVLYLVLPHFYGKTLHKLVAFTQHAGLARNLKDHRLSAREMYLNPILSFLYWRMEYHLTHHMFPTVPSYNLDKLHHHIKDQLPKPNNGLIDAYKEIIPTLVKQSKDANYFLKKDLSHLQNV
jgi:fatty acid desaturase